MHTVLGQPNTLLPCTMKGVHHEAGRRAGGRQNRALLFRRSSDRDPLNLCAGAAYTRAIAVRLDRKNAPSRRLTQRLTGCRLLCGHPLWWTYPPMTTDTQAFSNSTRLTSPTNRATRFAMPDEPRPQVGARRPRAGDLDRTVPQVLRHERRSRACIGVVCSRRAGRMRRNHNLLFDKNGYSSGQERVQVRFHMHITQQYVVVVLWYV